MKAGKLLLLACVGLVFGACSTRLDHLTKGPSMTAPGAPREIVPRGQLASPAEAMSEDYSPPVEEAGQGSLWRSGPQSLFGDRRARTKGDILTVVIEINENAEIRNRTNRTKTGEENLSVPALFGVQALAATALPGTSGLSPALDASSTSTTVGDGRTQREERITLRLAATVQRVLPNGHLVIFGDQEVRVNNELRDLQVAGVIRPEDISRQNLITYDKIASARVSYGGRGQLMDLQQPRYGSQIVDIISPF